MSTARVLARPLAATGFALAGVPVVEAERVERAAELVPRLLDEADVGVLLIEQELLDALPEHTRQALDRRAVPIVVPFQGPSWKAPRAAAEDRVLQLLRRAIGYRVRLR